MTQFTHIAYVAAETDYRLARARAQYAHRLDASALRHRVPRRPSLRLPRLRRRPVVVA